MSESFIEPDSLNTIFQNLSAVVDDDGATKFLNSEISSFNFDGLIPLETDTIQVNELVPGMQFILIGDSTNIIRTALKVEFDDPEMIDSPTDDYTISYLGPNGDVQTVTYSSTDEIEVYYEDWENKVLGTTGWTITQAGNAIFSNVAVRGRIEATEGLIDGDLIVTGSLSSSEDAISSGGVVFDSSGISAYDTSGNLRFFLDSESGDTESAGTFTGMVFRSNNSIDNISGDGVYLDDDGNVRFSSSGAELTFNENGLSIIGASVTIGGYATGQDVATASALIQARVSASFDTVFEDIGDIQSDIDNLYNAGFVTDTDLITNGATTINGNNITTGAIDANLVTVTSGLTGNRGIKINSLGLFAYDTSGNQTFNVNSQTGAVTIGSNNALNYITSTQLSTAGQTTINGGNITTGTINASLATITNINADNITSGTITGRTVRTSAGNTRVQLTSGDAGVLEFYYFGNQAGLITAYDVGLSLFGSPQIYLWDNVRVVGSIETTVSGSKIVPSSFTNAQTPLQVRNTGIGDNAIGVQSSTIDIKENIVPLTGKQSEVVPKEKDGYKKDKLLINPDNIFDITPVQYSIVGENPSIKEIGFIVEDLVEKWPSAVCFDKKNKAFAYNTNSIVSGLVYAVKTLRDRIEILEDKIIKLEMDDK